MPIYLRQSTASQEVTLGPFVDSTDGNTEETGLTIANTDILIHKAGGTTLPAKTSGGATHISNGIYYAVLDATDTNTIGPLVIYCHPSGALATRTECVVLDEAVYDVLFGTTAPSTYAGADTSGTTTLLSRLGTPSDLGGGATISANLSDIEAQTDDIGAAGAGLTALATQASVNTIDDFLDTEIAAIKAKTDNLPAAPAATGDIPSAATIADAVWDEDATAHQTQGTFGQAIGDPGADSDTIWAITNAQGATGTGLSAIPWNAAWDAEVESEVDDALGGGTGTALTAIPWNTSWDAEVQSEVQDALDATLADSVPSDGTRPSIAQAIYMVTQFLLERSVSGTTVTVKKVDGSTSLMTLTLNDATTPTSITRAT